MGDTSSKLDANSVGVNSVGVNSVINEMIPHPITLTPDECDYCQNSSGDIYCIRVPHDSSFGILTCRSHLEWTYRDMSTYCTVHHITDLEPDTMQTKVLEHFGRDQFTVLRSDGSINLNFRIANTCFHPFADSDTLIRVRTGSTNADLVTKLVPLKKFCALNTIEVSYMEDFLKSVAYSWDSDGHLI